MKNNAFIFLNSSCTKLNNNIEWTMANNGYNISIMNTTVIPLFNGTYGFLTTFFDWLQMPTMPDIPLCADFGVTLILMVIPFFDF